MPSLYLTVFRMSRDFFVSQNFSAHLGWSHLSFCQRERASRPASFFMGSLYPCLNLMSRTFFRAGRIFLDVRHTRDLMRKSKGRTARNHSPTVHEPIIARPDHYVKKKVRSFSFFFGMDFSVSECIRIISLFFS